MRFRCLMGLGSVLALLAGTARAGDDADLEKRVRDLEERLEASEARNEELAREVHRGNRDLVEREIDEYLQRTQELAGGENSGRETKKGAFVQLYGFLRLDLYFQTSRSNSVIVPSFVQPGNGSAVNANNEVFAFDARLTRVGFEFNFGDVGSSKVTGRLETDFANFPSGVPESRETPRIRLAYIQIESDKWRLRMGQDWDIASPLYPTANNEGVMWNAGNLGDRRPMIAFLWKGSGKLQIEGALGLTGAINNQDLDAGLMPMTFTTTERDGFDSGHPHFQGRASYTGDSWVEDRTWVIGFAGAIGTLETDTTFAGNDSFTTWFVSFDFSVPLTTKLLVKGEVWTGEALGDFRGTAGQAINTGLGKEIGGIGGWAELQYVRNDQWSFHLGGTIDDPDNADVPGSGVNLNFTVYVGTKRTWSSRLKSGFDVIFWETHYGGGAGLGNMIRFNFYTSVDF